MKDRVVVQISEPVGLIEAKYNLDGRVEELVEKTTLTSSMMLLHVSNYAGFNFTSQDLT